MIIGWTLVLEFRTQQFRIGKKKSTYKITYPSFSCNKVKIGAPLGKAKCRMPAWTTTSLWALGMSHPCSQIQSCFCLSSISSDASGMPNAAQRADERLPALHWKESEREETFLHEHTTDSAAALPLQPEEGCCAGAGQLCNRPPLLCAHARLVACTAALFSSFQLHHEGSNEWRHGDECVHPDESFARSVKFHQVCRQFRTSVAEIKGKKEKECCPVAELALHFASSLKQRKRKQADMKECAGEFPPDARPPGSKSFFRQKKLGSGTVTLPAPDFL